MMATFSYEGLVEKASEADGGKSFSPLAHNC